MDIGYYGDLDPVSGVGHGSRWLAGIVRDLAEELLLNDVVIFPPDNLIDHALALPAFEAFPDFVRAGLLTTTVDGTAAAPMNLVNDRLEAWAEGAPRAPQLGGVRERPSAHVRRRDALKELQDRWLAILPHAWTLHRDVGAQIAGFALRLRARCEVAPGSRASRMLLRVLDELEQAGVTPSRMVVLARLAAFPGAAPRDVAEAAFLVQTTYFELGAESHSSPLGNGGSPRCCRLFPGRFAHLLRDRRAAGPWDPGAPYDWDRMGTRSRERWRAVGADLDEILGLPPRALFEVATSSSWKALRRWVYSEEQEGELREAIAAQIRVASEVRDALPHLDRLLPAHPGEPTLGAAPVLLPSAWQYGVQTLLGACLPTSDVEGETPGARRVLLDVRSSTVTNCASGAAVTLPRMEGLLVTLLVLAGDAGLTERDFLQLGFEIDRIQSAVGVSWLDGWFPQWREDPQRDLRRRRWARAVKSRADRLLRGIGLRIQAGSRAGAWQVAHPAGPGHAIEITGTLWDLLDVPPALPPPPGLPEPQAALWGELAAAAPSGLSLAALAAVLGDEADEPGLKRTLDAVRRLMAHAAEHEEGPQVARMYKGCYALVPSGRVRREDLHSP